MPESSAAILKTAYGRHQSGDVDGAAVTYQSVIDADPKNADAWVYLGIARFDQRRFEDSADAYRRAIAIQPTYPIAWNNLGNSLRMAGRVDEADECFETSLSQNPTYLSALKNRGTLWVWTGEIDRGLQWYRRGLEVDPDHAELHRNLGVIELLRGNYDVGWDQYRWRWKLPGLYRPKTAATNWTGQSLSGKSILVYPEQGLGDAIHFVRVCQTLADRGASVVLQCAGKLVTLFSSTTQTLGVDRLIADAFDPPPTDFHVSMIEAIDVLYRMTGTIDHRSDLISPRRGYLSVATPLVDYWSRWLDANVAKSNASVKRIGINWQGNPEHHADVYRSVPLSILEPIAKRDDVVLVNLQFGRGSEQLDQCDFADSIVRLPADVDATEGAFTDTTAILQSLDGVVTTDTAIAHLAGAVGTPVQVMLGKVPDWRWLLSGETTPWYPTMRLVRQQRLGDWSDVVDGLAF